MKKLLTTIISLMFFGNLVFAQLTEFSQGDILSAGAMNQNFKYLENLIKLMSYQIRLIIVVNMLYY